MQSLGCSVRVQYHRMMSKSQFLFSQVNRSKDYYKLLGLAQSAKESDIKSAFFKLAKKYHPDVNPTAGEKFRDINEAYQVLSDKQQKEEYDQIRSSNSQSYSSQSSDGFRSSSQGRSQQSATEEMYNRYAQKSQRERQRNNNDNFQYYWESQNPRGYGNSYQQSQSNTEQYKKQREEERRQEDARINEAMKDFFKNVHGENNKTFHQFSNSYAKGRPINSQQQQYQQYNQSQQRQHQQQQQQYDYDPMDYYQKNYQQQQQKHRQNSFYDQHDSNTRSSTQDEWEKYKQNSQRMNEELERESLKEELRRQKEYELWQRQKDEMFMKELNDKVQQVKQNFINVGDKVEKVANIAEKAAKVLGSKVMNFFNKK